MSNLNALVLDSQGKPISGALVTLNLANATDWAKSGPIIFPNPRQTDGNGSANFVSGSWTGGPVVIQATAEAAGFATATEFDPAVVYDGSHDVTLTVSLNSFKKPFQAAPRFWKGANMCGMRVPGLPAVPGGAADAALVLSWFYDRYEAGDREKIRQAWSSRGYTHVLLSWPDSKAFSRTPRQFLDTCNELIAAGFYPCPMLYSKDFDPSDFAGIMANIQPVLPLLIGVVPLVCIGWELSIALSPTTVQELIDALAPQFTPAGTRVFVHFQQGYFAFEQPGGTTADFWNLNVGKLTGVLHQRVQEGPDEWDKRMYQARIVDCLDRFAGQDNFSPDSGFGHPFDFVALEITAEAQFNGQMSEAEGDTWGDTALATPTSYGPLGPVPVQGSGNGVSA